VCRPSIAQQLDARLDITKAVGELFREFAVPWKAVSLPPAWSCSGYGSDVHKETRSIQDIRTEPVPLG
jgi:hypothetical protein